MSRYRVALSIDPASQGALVELNHQELHAKAASTSTKLRDMCHSMRDREQQVQLQFSAKRIGDEERRRRIEAIRKEAGKQFARTLRAEAFNVDNELRRRLDPAVVGGIPEISSNVFSDDGATVDLLNLVPSGTPQLDDVIMCFLADSIDQLARLLPSDAGSAKP